MEREEAGESGPQGENAAETDANDGGTRTGPERPRTTGGECETVPPESVQTGLPRVGNYPSPLSISYINSLTPSL